MQLGKKLYQHLVVFFEHCHLMQKVTISVVQAASTSKMLTQEAVPTCLDFSSTAASKF
jgi:hypothetical protein